MVVSVSESHNRANAALDRWSSRTLPRSCRRVRAPVSALRADGDDVRLSVRGLRSRAHLRVRAAGRTRSAASGADTVGTGNPKQVLDIPCEVAKRVPQVDSPPAHTRGMGLANVVAGLEAITHRVVARRPRRLSPRARRDRKLCTEDLVHTLQSMGTHRHRPRPPHSRRTRPACARRPATRPVMTGKALTSIRCPRTALNGSSQPASAGLRRVARSSFLTRSCGLTSPDRPCFTGGFATGALRRPRAESRQRDVPERSLQP
jgi:hypothetical protein